MRLNEWTTCEQQYKRSTVGLDEHGKDLETILEAVSRKIVKAGKLDCLVFELIFIRKLKWILKTKQKKCDRARLFLLFVC